MKKIVIASACRTAIGKFGGCLLYTSQADEALATLGKIGTQHKV